MFKKFIFSGWGLFLTLFIYWYVLTAYFEYVINREVAKELQIVLALGVLAYTVFVIRFIVNFTKNNLKEKQND
mgnify:FL=1|jgi:uncharacterized membrane protein (DUF485 family)